MKEKIGEIGVDAGMVMVGDPCYFWPDANGKSEHTNAYPSWADVCAHHEKQLHYAKGHAGLGVIVGTTYGDGVYPVYLVTKNGKRSLVVELD